MRTLFDICKPRESVSHRKQRDDVLNLSDLIDGRIDPNSFFEENYVTGGMKTLFDTTFNRFAGNDPNGVIKLTQSMGGGKTHNMLALGLLALNPLLRNQYLPDNQSCRNLGRVRLVAFTGRESDAPLGIWGSIASQLGKKEQFRQYYSPLSAPGESAWVDLLKGDPLLILLDELPPYLENARSKPIGNSDLCVVTTTALANLFTALGKIELSNVCLVISDLKASYESGSEQIRKAFRSLENELARSALDIEPVGSATDDVYHILKKRLFVKLPDAMEINNIAKAYQDAVTKAKHMGYTHINPDRIFIGIKDSYPFHPSIRDLYARFKENPGFQQTRGLLRLMRQIVAKLYESGKASQKYLINVHDFDLNDNLMHTTITQIKTSLTNAIAHDIADNNKSIAEELDAQYKDTIVQDIAKLILVSSLADIPNPILGLTLGEIIAYICEPGRDIGNIRSALDDLRQRSWYLKNDNEGKLFFQNTKNMNAELQDLVESYDNESVKSTTLKTFLEERFKPTIRDCYQNIMVFPAIDQINPSLDKVTLILFEPYAQQGLHPDLQDFYDYARFKNRVLFLSGRKDTMDHLYKSAKDLKAIEKIISDMTHEKTPEKDPQFQLAQDIRVKKIQAVLSSAQQTFSVLFYPNKNGIAFADFIMQFVSNNYNGEDQIRKLLLDKHKFIDSPIDQTFRKKCEDRLFTRQEMLWKEIIERAATEPSWQWHHPDSLENLKKDCFAKGLWKQEGDTIKKGPFPKEPTKVHISENKTLEDNEETITLYIRTEHGDTVRYTDTGDADEDSTLIKDLKNFRTNEIRLSFICIDSKGIHPTGPPVEWKRKIDIKYKPIDKPDGQYVKLESHPKVRLKYTTDGSNPKQDGIPYQHEFKAPDNTSHILVVAEYDNEYIADQTFKYTKDSHKIEIDMQKPLTLTYPLKTQDSQETYDHINALKEFSETLYDVNIVIYIKDKKGFIDLTLDDTIAVKAHTIEESIDNIKSLFIPSANTNIQMELRKIRFKTGQAFYDWLNKNNLNLKDINISDISQK